MSSSSPSSCASTDPRADRVFGTSDEADAPSPGRGLVFLAVAVAGFRSSLWLAVIALAGHGALDSVHGALIANPGVPPWWPPFCLSYDVAAAGTW